MTDSVNGAGPASGNWFQKVTKRVTKALRGFLHFGSVSKTPGKSHIKAARLDAAKKPEGTSVHKRNIQQVKSSELPSVRLPDKTSNRSPVKNPPLPLMETDPLQEKMYEAQMQLMEMNQRWQDLHNQLEQKTAQKKKLGNEFHAARKKAGLDTREALKSPRLATPRKRFEQAVSSEKNARLHLNNLEKNIARMEIAIGRFQAAENRQAERELKQLLADR